MASTKGPIIVLMPLVRWSSRSRTLKATTGMRIDGREPPCDQADFDLSARRHTRTSRATYRKSRFVDIIYKFCQVALSMLNQKPDFDPMPHSLLRKSHCNVTNFRCIDKTDF